MPVMWGMVCVKNELKGGKYVLIGVEQLLMWIGGGGVRVKQYIRGEIQVYLALPVSLSRRL